MTMDAQSLTWDARTELFDPFAGASPAREANGAVGFAPWRDNLSPFTEGEQASETDSERLFAEAFSELRDEGFDEALAFLAEETEQAIADRFTSESAASAVERERFGEAYLSNVRYEAEQYLDSLQAGLNGKDLESFNADQLDELLDQFDPQIGELTPAGEEFIGSLISKAKKAVKGVVSKVTSVAGSVAGTLLGPVLNRLRALVSPLLKRVLSFAVGRLPKALQPAARIVASHITSEAEDESIYMSPAMLTDVEYLAESFDAAMAEAISSGVTGDFEGEEFLSGDSGETVEGRELETLAGARGALIDRIKTADDSEDLAPAVEQFVPALLGALRLGVKLVGRPKVVSFLAKYVGELIKKWVQPSVSGSLSKAIVDTGLRMVSLESETGAAEAAPVALASVVEDTVRRLAENEDYIFEDETLMQLAAADAFGEAVATHFPARFVRSDLQHAPSLGGTFVTRRARGLRPYHKYSRTPEIEITSQIADTLPTFGGASLGATLRAAGASFPFRARAHIYQAAPGTTLPRMLKADRSQPGGRGYFSTANVHPLTPQAAGVLLREPKLGVSVPPEFLRSRNRIAVGQRFFALEPVGVTGALALPAEAVARSVAPRLAPSRAWMRTNLRAGRITIGIFLSETESQSVVAALRQGKGGAALLQALVNTYRMMDQSSPQSRESAGVQKEDSEDFEELAFPRRNPAPKGIGTALRARVRAWVLPALAEWVRTNAEAFARAAARPDSGVTVLIRLTALPGLDALQKAVSGGLSSVLPQLRGTPAIAISVKPGRQRR
jgi:hypothetical protein